MIIKFLRDETGLELSEYAVAASLVAVAAVAANHRQSRKVQHLVWSVVHGQLERPLVKCLCQDRPGRGPVTNDDE